MDVLLEARASSLAGLVVWSFHRDSREPRRIGTPVFTCAAIRGCGLAGGYWM